jgi:hypothetical protein
VKPSLFGRCEALGEASPVPSGATILNDLVRSCQTTSGILPLGSEQHEYFAILNVRTEIVRVHEGAQLADLAGHLRDVLRVLGA